MTNILISFAIITLVITLGRWIIVSLSEKKFQSFDDFVCNYATTFIFLFLFTTIVRLFEKIWS